MYVYNVYRSVEYLLKSGGRGESTRSNGNHVFFPRPPPRDDRVVSSYVYRISVLYRSFIDNIAIQYTDRLRIQSYNVFSAKFLFLFRLVRVFEDLKPNFNEHMRLMPIGQM